MGIPGVSRKRYGAGADMTKELEIRFLAGRLLDIAESPESYSPDVRRQVADEALQFLERVRTGDSALSDLSFSVAKGGDIEAAGVLVEALVSLTDKVPQRASRLVSMFSESRSAIEAIREGSRPRESESRSMYQLFGTLYEHARSRTSGWGDEVVELTTAL